MKILMTGCSSGFGVHVKHRFEEEGHDVFGVGLNGPNLTMDFEAATQQNVAEAVNRAKYDLGGLDALIYNAGTTQIDFLGEHKEYDFDRVLKVNLGVAFAFARSFYHATSDGLFTTNWDNTDGKVGPAGQKVLEPKPVYTTARRMIFTTSMGAVSPLRGSPGYCASKAGLEMMLRVLAKELSGKEPYVVMGVAPGMVDQTEMNKYVIQRLIDTRGMTREEAVKYATSLCPIGRPCSHEEVYQVYKFALQAPEYMTGEILRMPGGG